MTASPMDDRMLGEHAHIRWIYFLLLSAGLLSDLGLGVWEMGWNSFLQTIRIPHQANPLLHLLSYPVVYVSAFGMLTGMLWPLLAAGIAMTMFVAVRLRRERNRFLRTRLSMAVAAYFLLTATMPLLGGNFPVVPNPGGTGDPAWTFATAISMLVFVLLALFFGRGSYCGVICPAATYWGGLGQHFIRWNTPSHRAERVARITRPLLLALFLITTVVSVLDTFHVVHMEVLGTDPAVFFSGLVWMVIWFLMLAMSPLIGNRAFTRYLCPMGSFLGYIARAGFFRVVARDPTRCQTCTSRACAASCEVSLDVATALAGAGFLRSPGCVGCGNCAAACPEGNIWYDNAWIRLRDRLPLSLGQMRRSTDSAGTATSGPHG